MKKKKQTVLVIEDELVNRKIIWKILESSYEVIQAENGKVGLEQCMLHTGSISAILLDLTMPVMNGYEFLEAIRGTPYSAIPIIVMTGSSDAMTEQKALKAGAWDFIPKPYNATILNIRLQNAIARSKMDMFDQIKHMSEHDALTGLYNRNKMFEDTRAMTQSVPGQDYVFIRVDIDHFSLYNSSFGEKAGDELLCFFADIIRDSAEGFGTAVYGRITSDVFCLCTPFDGDHDKLFENLNIGQKKLNEYSKDYMLKISAGAYVITASETENLNVGECYLKASFAAQRCKHRFDSLIEYYDEETRKRIDRSITIANEMQGALEREEFVVYFQPKYRVSTNCPCGAEALIRWKHPTKGLISPGNFIPVFESNGFIAKVDYYVWEHTCRCLRKWMDAGRHPQPISVNVSRVSLYNVKLDQVLLELIRRYDIDPSLLELEITESAYMTSPERMHELVSRLHALGFRILMDDFGSDYSSLNALKNIEVDVLKIDMAFVPKGNEIEKGEIILASIIKMAKWIGMDVIVEGVETRRQRNFLEGAGCDAIQGFYYSKPIPPEEYEEEYVYSDRKMQTASAKKEAQLRADRPGTVLVIDDTEDARDMLLSYLDPFYQVETRDSAEEGLVYLRRNPDQVKLIIIDNIMPGMSGIDFLRFCQNDNDLRSIPKVMITTSDSVGDQLAAFDAGAYDYITKPFVREIALARVRHVMDMTYRYTGYDRIRQEFSMESERDQETSLLNHPSFRELSDRMMTAFPDDLKALLLIDLDNFNHISQTCGHDRGRELLHRIAQGMKREFRKSDVIGRISGEEYAVLLCGIPDRKIAQQKSLAVISKIASLGNVECGMVLNTSVGLVYPAKGDTIDTIMAKADQALLEAKQAPQGTFVIYGESPVEEEEAGA